MADIQLPDDLTSLSDEDLAGLIEQINAAGEDLIDAEPIPENTAELQRLADLRDQVQAEVDNRAAVASEAAAAREAAIARFRGDNADPTDTVDEATPADDEPTVDETAPELEPVLAAATPAPVEKPPVAPVRKPTAAGLTTQRPAANKPVTASPARDFMRASAHAKGVKEGHQFSTAADVAKAIVDTRLKFAREYHGPREQLAIATGAIPIGRRLGQDAAANFAVLRDVQSDMHAMVASGAPQCAPLSPSYEFYRLAEPQNPVEQAVPAVEAERGGIRYIVPVSTAAAAGAIDLSAQDRDYTDEGDGPKACVRVSCPGVDDAWLEAISKCVTFDNLQYRVFPELVENFLEDLAVQYASRKEVYYLDGINANSTLITGDFEYGASRGLLYHWSTATVHYRKRHGMRRSAKLLVFAPDWAIEAIKLDMALDGQVGHDYRAISDSDAEAFLRARNIEPVWYNDNPTGVSPSQKWNGPQTTGPINSWPAKVTSFIHAPGTFVRLNGGTLDVGLVRDSVLNGTNDLQLFEEEWLGFAKLGFESLRIDSTVCINGAGPAGVEAISCG